MKRGILLIVFCMLKLIPGYGYSELTFETTSRSYTLDWDESAAVLVFPFVNQGEHEVTIRRVATSCGCTSIFPGIQRTIKPGEKGKVKARYEAGDRTGIQIEKLYIQTDEGGEKVHTLQLLITLPQVARLAPGVLSWKHGTDYQEKTMKIRWMGEHTTELDMKLPDFSGWSISIKETVKGKEWLLYGKPENPENAGMIQVPLVFKGKKAHRLEAILMTFE